MPKSKAEMMRRLRQQRKRQGFVELRLTVTPGESKKIHEYLGKLRESNSPI